MTLLFRCGSCGYDYPRRFFPWWSVGRCKVCRALGRDSGILFGAAYWHVAEEAVRRRRRG